MKNITSIRNNSNLRRAYLQQVYEIKRLSYKNINFFERTIIDSRVEVNKKSKGDEIKKHVNDFNKDMLSMSRLIDRLSSPIILIKRMNGIA